MYPTEKEPIKSIWKGDANRQNKKQKNFKGNLTSLLSITLKAEELDFNLPAQSFQLLTHTPP